MNHHADVVFYIRLLQISIEICGHQSSNWFNNSLKLPPFSNDLDKNRPKYVIFDTCAATVTATTTPLAENFNAN